MKRFLVKCLLLALIVGGIVFWRSKNAKSVKISLMIR